MKKFIAFTFLVATCSAQVYTASTNVTVAGSAAALTIQQPASASRQVTFISAYFDCSVACVFTLSVNGTPATATAGTVNNVNPAETAAKATAWTASNVGAGTTLTTYNCTSACSFSIDLTGITFAQGLGTGTNLTLKSSSITGTVDIIFKFSEKTL